MGEYDLEPAYVVLDATEGTVLDHRLCHAATLNSTKGARTSDGELMTIDNDKVVVTAFGAGGARRELGPAPGGIPWALLVDRFVSHGNDGSQHETIEVVTTDLFGRDPRPFLRIRPYAMVA